jgi:hypothetical protein
VSGFPEQGHLALHFSPDGVQPGPPKSWKDTNYRHLVLLDIFCSVFLWLVIMEEAVQESDKFKKSEKVSMFNFEPKGIKKGVPLDPGLKV